MAPIIEGHPAPNLQERLRSLTDQQVPFANRLIDAVAIIGLDPNRLATLVDQGFDPDFRSPFPAKEEAVLKWLLKELHVSQGKTPRCTPGAWLLLQKLIKRIPLRPAASALQEHKFIDIVDKALEEAVELIQDWKVGDKFVKPNIIINSQTPLTNIPRDSDSYIALFSSVRLPVCVLRILDEIRELIGNDIEELNPAQQHMKAVLRASPEVAARILGHASTLADNILALPASEEHDSKNFIINDFVALLQIWVNRSTNSDDPLNKVSNDAFSAHCLRPILWLLWTCKNKYLPKVIPDAKPTATLVKPLQSLLARHVILPLRTSFFESGLKTATLETIATITSVTPFPTLKTQIQKDSNANISNEPTSTANTSLEVSRRTPSPLILPLTIMYDITLKITRRDNPTRQLKEDPWLETLLCALLEISGLDFKRNDQVLESEHRKILQKLLNMSLKRRVTLSTGLLADIAARFCGLWRIEEPAWDLLAEILGLDSSVFVGPSESVWNRLGKEAPEELPKTTKELLDQLFKKINIAEPSDFLRSRIMIPLMNAFSKARDLTRFTGYWKEQLFIFLDPYRPIGNREFSIWEDEDILIAFSNPEVVSTSSTAQEISILKASMTNFQGMQGNPDDARAASVSVILEGLVLRSQFWGNVEEDVILRIKALSDDILSNFAMQKSTFRWRFLRLLRVIYENFPRLLQDTPIESLSKLFRSLKKVIKEANMIYDESADCLASRCIEVYEAFYLFALCINLRPDEQPREKAKKVAERFSEIMDQSVQNVAKYVNGITDSLDNKNGDKIRHHGMQTWPCTWDGKRQNLRTVSELSAGLISMTLRFPQVFLYASSDKRQQFFGPLCHLANIYTHLSFRDQLAPENPRDPEMPPLFWDAFLGCAALQEDKTLFKEMLQAHIDQFKKSSPDDIYLELALSAVPLETLQRSQRERILDLVGETLIHSTSMSKGTTESPKKTNTRLSLMCKLMEVPNASAKISVEANVLLAIADSLKDLPNMSSVGIYQRLAELTLSHLIITKDQPRSSQYLSQIKAIVFCSMTETGSFLGQCARRVLCGSVVYTFQKHDIDLHDSTIKSHIDVEYWNVLVSDLHKLAVPGTWIEDPTSRLDLQVILKELIRCPEKERLLSISKDITSLINTVHRQQALDTPNLKEPYINKALALLQELNFIVQGSDTDKPSQIDSLLNELQNPIHTRDEQASLLRRFKALVQNDSPTEISTILHKLESACSNPHSATGLPALFSVLHSITEPHSLADRALLRTSLSECYFHLLDLLTHEITNIPRFIVIADMLTYLLIEKRWATTQPNINTTLSAIVKMTSPEASLNPSSSKHTEGIYSRLCQLLAAISTRHRREIEGRLHLVVPALQGLMKCLFEGASPGGRNSTKSSLPRWILLKKKRAPRENGNSNNNIKTKSKTPTLTPAHATQFSTLLTSICDPTPSSVTPHPHHHPKPQTLTTPSTTTTPNNLTNPITLAKSHAGTEGMQYLLPTYCILRLQTPLPAETNQALLPGLYAVLNCVGYQGVRAVNADFRGEERAVFRRVWEEWRGEGGWGGGGGRGGGKENGSGF
ncbi:MAG: hypothetical protein M1834_006851 [Cirrosporium novae-zelandiae]|nr:MAG: hypothetical protein M1834_006851 [Cirrosporium novae-zelandiae]